MSGTRKYQKPDPVVFDRTPPQDLVAERSVLGAMLLNPDAVGAAIEILGFNGGDMFYNPQHTHVYDAAVALFRHNLPVDAVTMMGELTRSGNLEAAGGASHLAELTRCVPTSANIEIYARQVENMAVLRNCIITATQLTSEAYSGTLSAEEIIAKFQTDINRIADRKSTTQIVSAGTIAQRVTNETEAMIASGKGTRGIEIGIRSLDDLLYGLKRKNLVIIGARPSVGKSAFALSIAEHAAIELDVPVLIFSLEMGDDELIMRTMQSISGVNSERIQTAFQAHGEIPKMQAATNILMDVPLQIVDKATINIVEVKTIARRFAAKYKGRHGLIIIDYLQLLSPVDRKVPRQEQVAEMSREAKQLAGELGWTVIALSQLTRPQDGSEKKRPVLSNLRESGAIEQDANVVLLMHEESADNEFESKLSINVAKHRGGAKGIRYVTYDKRSQRFFDQGHSGRSDSSSDFEQRAAANVGQKGTPANFDLYYEEDEMVF